MITIIVVWSYLDLKIKLVIRILSENYFYKFVQRGGFLSFPYT